MSAQLALAIGRTCNYCHEWKLGDQFTLTNGRLHSKCKACKRAHDKARYESDPAHRQRVIDRANKWQAENYDRAEAKWRKWRHENRERKNETERRRRLRNPAWERERAVAQVAKRRARKMDNGVYYVSLAELRAIRARPCFACGDTGPSEVDHVIPIARGGQHSVGNLMPLCRHCNVSKGKLTWTEWRYSQRPRAVEVFGADRRAV